MKVETIEYNSSTLFSCSEGKFTQLRKCPVLFAREENSFTNSETFEEYFEKSTPEKLVLTAELFVNIFIFLLT